MNTTVQVTQCGGYIGHNGHCTKCGQVSLVSSTRCIQMIPIEPVQNCLISGVSVSSPKIHLVDVDGDIIESLNIMSHAEKLRDAINSDPESIAHHYQVMILDER